MTTFVRAASAAVGLAIVLFGASATAGDAPPVEAKAAFERMKTLAGEWKLGVGDAHNPHVKPGETGKILYKVTSNGSVVMETFFPGTSEEMVTMFHLDGDELRLTHYCAAKNQPHLKLDKKASTADEYVFAFDGGTNFDPAVDMHMHNGKIKFLKDGKVEETWEGYINGKKGHGMTFPLSRP
jgi:hypothetical protein